MHASSSNDCWCQRLAHAWLREPATCKLLGCSFVCYLPSSSSLIRRGAVGYKGGYSGRYRALLAPVVRGTENIPDGLAEPRAVLFVGNHTRFGMYDMPFLMMELHLRGHNVRARPPCSQLTMLLSAQ